MRITKVSIRNLFGIKEMSADGKNIELSGNNGKGKTSFIEAIRLGLTGKSSKPVVVMQGESEGEILIETDTGLSITRRRRINKADYDTIKSADGKDIPAPESFLRNEVFKELQLNPIEFIDLPEKEQNRIILDLIDFKWDMLWFKEKFGEIPQGIDYSQNILAILGDIQSEKSPYYQDRQKINHRIRANKAMIEEIGKSLPENYNADKWREIKLADVYKKIEAIRHENNRIETARKVVEQADNKKRSFQAEKEIVVAAIERETSAERERLEKENIRLENQLKTNKERIGKLAGETADKIISADKDYQIKVKEYDAKVEEYKDVADKQTIDLTEMTSQAAHVEKMRELISEFDRMISLTHEAEDLVVESDELTRKIELARTLPGEILEQCSLPIKSLTIKDGVPLINGLPVCNLSEGEKLQLAVDIASRNQSALTILLLDGMEKLSDENRLGLYQKLKDKGVQFVCTRTSNEKELNVTEI